MSRNARVNPEKRCFMRQVVGNRTAKEHLYRWQRKPAEQWGIHE